MTHLVIRLYIPEDIRNPVITQYHESSGHMGIDKIYDAIKVNTTGLMCTRNYINI